MKNDYDVVIIGAGPAGLGLANFLSKSNSTILLLDKKKNAADVQYNTAGTFIDPRDFDLPAEAFNPIKQAYLCSKNRKFLRKVKGYIIDRRKLLQHLELKAKANKNAKIEYEAEVDDCEFDNGNVKSITYRKEGKSIQATAKIFVDCSGVGKVMAREDGLVPETHTVGLGMEYVVPVIKEKDTAALFLGSEFAGGYGWIFPKNAEVTIVGYCTLNEKNFKGVEQYLDDMWKLDVVSERCGEKKIERNTAILNTGEPLLSFAKGNMVAIGDAVRQANPIVGEGVRFCLDSSRMAAEWIEKALKEDNLELLNNYSEEWKKKYYKKFYLDYKLQQLLKRITANDKKTDRLVEFTAKIPTKDFVTFLSGDLSYWFLVKMFFKGLWRVLI